MQYSIVQLSELESSSRRLDAGYYSKSAIAAERLLKRGKWDYLKDLAQSIKSFGAYSLNNAFKYRSDGTPFLRAVDIKDGLIDFSTVLYVDKEANKILWKSEIKPETTLLTMSGTVGESSVTTVEMAYPMNSSQDVAKIVTNGRCNPYYLSVFLQSRYGKAQTSRLPIGSVQQHIFLWQIEKLVVPILSRLFQSRIEGTFKEVLLVRKKSNDVYEQASNKILAELGIPEWRPKHNLTFVKNYSELKLAQRFDADYFQPQYDEVVDAIKNYPGGWRLLGQVVNLKDRTFIPQDLTEYRYIELANIASNGEISGCMIAEGQELPSRARRRVSSGDVIVSSIEGSLSSIALIGSGYDQALCSTGFHVVNSSVINSETLLVLLKSVVGQQQLKKGSNGTILASISKNEFRQIVIPFLSEVTQDQIRELVGESFRLRRQSKQLLEKAKRAVEIAIEEDEGTAIDWLKRETSEEDLGSGLVNSA